MNTTEQRVIECFQRGQYTVTCPIPDDLHIVDEASQSNYANRKQYGAFRILTAKDGDKRIIWDKFSLPEIQAAKEMFKNLIKQGLMPFRVNSKGQQTTEMMKDFDPQAEEVIFVPTPALCPG